MPLYFMMVLTVEFCYGWGYESPIKSLSVFSIHIWNMFYLLFVGVDVQVGGEVDPLLALARVKEEREKVFGKKSNFLRRRGLDPYAGM